MSPQVSIILTVPTMFKSLNSRGSAETKVKHFVVSSDKNHKENCILPRYKFQSKHFHSKKEKQGRERMNGTKARPKTMRANKLASGVQCGSMM
jgi:hypothetical protein